MLEYNMMECMGNDVVRHSNTSDVLFNTSQRFSTVCTENKMGRHKNDHHVCSWQRCWNQIDLCTCRLKTLCTETWSGLFLKPSWSKSNCKHAEISMQKYYQQISQPLTFLGVSKYVMMGCGRSLLLIDPQFLESCRWPRPHPTPHPRGV